MCKWGEMSYNKYNQDNYDTEPDVFDNIDDTSNDPECQYGYKSNVYDRLYDEVVAGEEVKAYVLGQDKEY